MCVSNHTIDLCSLILSGTSGPGLMVPCNAWEQHEFIPEVYPPRSKDKVTHTQQANIRTHKHTHTQVWERSGVLISAPARVFLSLPWELTGRGLATKQRALENNRKELVRNTLYLTPRNTSLPPPQKQKCVNTVVNNTDLLQIDVLVFTVCPSLRRLFIVAAEREGQTNRKLTN